MKVIPNGALQNPNACTICEETPTGDAVVDTERYTPFNPVYPLNGRKYLCERCAKEIANTIGFHNTDAVAVALQAQARANVELANIRQRVVELADHIKDFVYSADALDYDAAAEKLAQAFNQADSAAKSAIEAAKGAVEKPKAKAKKAASTASSEDAEA